MRLPCSALTATVVLWVSGVANAATLPSHDPLSIVIVSDEVNPNNLSDAELTQPGDISAALQQGGSGINVASVVEYDSACVDDALTALATGVDVFIYFAHRPAEACGGGSAQAELTAAVRDHLESGGGVVVFHHGSYQMEGKDDILQLLGVTAENIDWQPSAGQAVIAVGLDHFVSSNGLEFPETRNVSDDSLGVTAADYPAFVNVPDERYPGVYYRTESGEARTTLFVSDYAGVQILSYDLWRPTWAGHVVMYQPGEYQPNALDALDGNNFQILANAIYYVATTQEEPAEDGGNDDAANGTDGGNDSADGTTGGDGSVDDSGGNDDATNDDSTDDSGDDGTSGDGGANANASCSCTADDRSTALSWLVALGALGLGVRRRSLALRRAR